MLNGTLSLTRAKEIYEYNGATGIFVRKAINHAKDKIGEIAGTRAKNRIVIGIDGVQYDAGKLAIFMHTGEAPYKVYYKDGDRFNVKLSNLIYLARKPDVRASEPVPVNILRSLFRIDYETGALVRNISTYRARNGARAGHILNNGYLAVSVIGTRALVHRVVWAIHFGEWPSGDIDHIDNDKTNNRISNLRIATRSENGMNTRLRRDNSTGVKSVVYNKRNMNYRARLVKEHKAIEVGSFATIQDAEKAVKLARKKIHGDFCNHG